MKFNNSVLGLIIAIVDSAAVFLCYQIAFVLLSEPVWLYGLPLVITIMTMLSSSLILSSGGLYRLRRGESLWQEIRSLLLCWVVTLLLVSAVLFIAKLGVETSRLWFGSAMLAAFVVQAVVRLVLWVALRIGRQHGFNRKRVAVVGAGPIGRSIGERLARHPSAGFDLIGYVDDRHTRLDSSIREDQVLGPIESLPNILHTAADEGRPVDQVWVSVATDREGRLEKMLLQLQDSAVDVCFVPLFLGREMTRNTSIKIVADVPLIQDAEMPLGGERSEMKAAFDYLVAMTAIVVLLPVMLFIALSIKLDSSGPVFYKQHRFGVRGRKILVWKFRTMYQISCPAQSAEIPSARFVQAQRGDSRITRVGAFLRRTSLDELPQLFNVLQGSMSIVGPRPHDIEHSRYMHSCVSRYMFRHRIKPGITGLAQVSGYRGVTDTQEKIQGRLDRDVEYIENWSFLLDLKIIARTLREVVSSRTAH